MLPRSQLRCNKLYCFTILTPFDNLWVYKNKRLKKKKEACNLKNMSDTEKGKKRKNNLASCDSGERQS